MSDDHIETHAANRLDAFVDAAFAFAVSLLVIATAAPPADLDDLWQALGRIPASAGAFALIAVFWFGHRAFGKLTRKRDGVTQYVSLAIVFTVLNYVYPLRLLTETGFYWMSGGRLPGRGVIQSLGDLQQLFTIYGLGFALLAGFYALLFRHAVRKAEALDLTPQALDDARDHAAIWIILAVSGLLSALLASVGPMSVLPGLPGFAYWAIPLAIWGRFWLKARRAKKVAKAAS